MLGSDHILGLQSETMAAAEGQQLVELQRLAEPFGQGWVAFGKGQKGIEGSKGQGMAGEGICRVLS